MKRQEFHPAAERFQAGLQEAELLAAAAPGDPQYRNQLLEALANLADAQEASGQLEKAIGSRERQLDLLERSTSKEPGDAALKVKSVAAHRALGRLFASRGQATAGISHLKTAVRAGDELLRTEPDNAEWQVLAAAVNIELGELLHLSNLIDEAGRASRAGCDVAERLIRRNTSVADWRYGAMRSCLTLRAKLAVRRGETSDALSLASRALAHTGPLRENGDDLSRRYAAASAQMLVGDIQYRTARPEDARKTWRGALAALPQSNVEWPSSQALRVLLLRRLGQREEAERRARKLETIGYRHPAYLEGTG